MRVDYEELQEIRLKSREALTKAKAVESGPNFTPYNAGRKQYSN